MRSSTQRVTHLTVKEAAQQAWQDSGGDFKTATDKMVAMIESDADLCWLLGILNSRLMGFWFLSVYGGDRLHGGYLRIGPPQLRTLPVPEYDQANNLHRVLAARVRQLLVLLERGAAGRAQVLEEQIDQLVYRIYGLTDAERLVVEQSAEPMCG